MYFEIHENGRAHIGNSWAELKEIYDKFSPKMPKPLSPWLKYEGKIVKFCYRKSTSVLSETRIIKVDKADDTYIKGYDCKLTGPEKNNYRSFAVHCIIGPITIVE